MQAIDVIKVIAFGFTFYFMVDYVYSCDTSTTILTIIITVLFGAIILFYWLYIAKNKKRCECCKQII